MTTQEFLQPLLISLIIGLFIQYIVIKSAVQSANKQTLKKLDDILVTLQVVANKLGASIAETVLFSEKLSDIKKMEEKLKMLSQSKPGTIEAKEAHHKELNELEIKLKDLQSKI